MNVSEERKSFEASRRVYERAALTFHGVEPMDVYNPSIPFDWQGQTYIYGRVENRGDWARSTVRLFARSGPDDWTAVPGAMIYPLEDPYVARIDGELVLGGTHVRIRQGQIDAYYAYFYRGADLRDLVYFTTGPKFMKDIRLVQLADGRVGVFSRPQGAEILRQTGSLAQVGFTIIDRLADLNAEVIAAAAYIPGLFGPGEWGACNQAYLLADGQVGVIGHRSYQTPRPGDEPLLSYLNIAFVFDPLRHAAHDLRIIGTRACYPDGPSKRPDLADVAFTAGIVRNAPGRVDLYSGLGDAGVGRIVIDDPFAGSSW